MSEHLGLCAICSKPATRMIDACWGTPCCDSDECEQEIWSWTLYDAIPPEDESPAGAD